MKSKELLDQAKSIVERIIAETENEFLPLSYEKLYARPATGKWSAAECFAHLCSYNAHYNGAFREAIQGAQKMGSTPLAEHHSTWLGRLCIKTVHPERIGKKMKTIARHNYIDRTIEGDILSRFLSYQRELLELIEMARAVNLQKTKVKIEIAKWLRLNLGDFFFFLIHHEERHLLQAKNALKNQG